MISAEQFRSKKPLIVGSAVVGGLLVLFIANYFWMSYHLKPPLSPENPAPPETLLPNGEETAPVYTAFGTITEIHETGLSISVDPGGSHLEFQFVRTPETGIYDFFFTGDDDLTGTTNEIGWDQLKIGSQVAVYADEALGSISPQPLTKIIKTGG